MQFSKITDIFWFEYFKTMYLCKTFAIVIDFVIKIIILDILIMNAWRGPTNGNGKWGNVINCNIGRRRRQMFYKKSVNNMKEYVQSSWRCKIKIAIGWISARTPRIRSMRRFWSASQIFFIFCVPYPSRTQPYTFSMSILRQMTECKPKYLAVPLQRSKQAPLTSCFLQHGVWSRPSRNACIVR